MVNPKNSYELPESFLYIDLESVKQGILFKKEIIVKETAPSRAQRCLIINDILYSCVRPYQHNNYIFKMNEKVVASTGFAVLRGQPSSTFLYSLIDSKKFESKVMNRCTGTSYPAINSSNLASIVINVPSREEQIKIGNFLDIINARIECQNKIIEDLFLLKKSITHNVFNNSSSEKIKLCNLIDISTGKRDANESDEHGIYPFFTCGKETLKINKYSFEGESLLISGNGEIGQVKYYSGKFDAYQRTYVLQNSKSPILYLKAYLEFILPMIVEREKQQSAMPYIVLGTLKNIDVPILDMNKTNNIISTFKAIDKKIERENKYKELLNKEKRYLLSNLFI